MLKFKKFCSSVATCLFFTKHLCLFCTIFQFPEFCNCFFNDVENFLLSFFLNQIFYPSILPKILPSLSLPNLGLYCCECFILSIVSSIEILFLKPLHLFVRTCQHIILHLFEVHQQSHSNLL